MTRHSARTARGGSGDCAPHWSPELEALGAGLVLEALDEDLGIRGDVTSEAVVGPQDRASGRILARGSGVLAGVSIAARCFEHFSVEVKVEREDASEVAPGDGVLVLSGAARGILAAERTALNFLGRLSGIATLTARYVRLAAPHGTRVLDTRKTTPTFRRLEKYAVACGGGVSHRSGLYDMVLLKENHVALAGGIEAAVRCARSVTGGTVAVEVEVRTLAELESALRAPVDRIMLDNFSNADLRSAVQRCGGRVPLEASGGIDLDTVETVAATGVDYVSVGALTHSAPCLDLSLLLDVVPSV